MVVKNWCLLVETVKFQELSQSNAVVFVVILECRISILHSAKSSCLSSLWNEVQFFGKPDIWLLVYIHSLVPHSQSFVWQMLCNLCQIKTTSGKQRTLSILQWSHGICPQYSLMSFQPYLRQKLRHFLLQKIFPGYCFSGERIGESFELLVVICPLFTWVSKYQYDFE